jgi:hypothetical protein
MNTVRTLSLALGAWPIAVAVLAVVICAAVSYYSWRRAGSRSDHGLLEALRVVLVAFGAILFLQPEWVEERRPEEKPTIAVLYDDSTSMETRDVVVSGGAQTTATTRREAIAPVLEGKLWDSLRDRYEVVIQPLSATSSESGEIKKGVTNLTDPLTRAPRDIKNLMAVVLLSDGDWNAGDPPAQAASALRLQGIPVFTATAGSPTRLPDIELISLDAPTFGVAGKSVRIPFAIDSAMPREHVATVKLTSSDGDEVTKEVRIAPMGRTTDALVWKPKDIGDYTVTLDVPKHTDELLADNNKLTAPIAIRAEKLKVLVVESVPRWEYRFLRNALSRDPGIDLSCLLYQPGLAKSGGGSKDYIRQFPSGLEELSKFDVVFLGDVGVEDGQLTPEDCRLLKGIVEHQASGLVFLPGTYGREMTLLETELADLCPVALDVDQPGGWGSRTASHFELTELGRRSLLTKLADTNEENAEVWESLPGFQWYAPVIRAKAGAEVLCVHKDAENEHGRLPLLVTKTYGAGKVLFMGTDGAWRWRKGVEDKYHYRFWGQVVRWMAYQRNLAKGETMRMYYSPEQPQVGQSLSLRANVMERSGEPLRDGEVTARIVAPSGKPETVRFRSTGDEWGAFAATYAVEEPGTHEVTLKCKQTGATLTTTITAQGSPYERIGRAARPEVMEEIARVTRGSMIALEHPQKFVESLEALPEAPPAIARLQLWCHPATASVFVALIAVFWVGRKAIGFI